MIIILNNVSNVFAEFEFQHESIHTLKVDTSVLCWVRELICKLDPVCNKIYYNSFWHILVHRLRIVRLNSNIMLRFFWTSNRMFNFKLWFVWMQITSCDLVSSMLLTGWEAPSIEYNRSISTLSHIRSLYIYKIAYFMHFFLFNRIAFLSSKNKSLYFHVIQSLLSTNQSGPKFKCI